MTNKASTFSSAVFTIIFLAALVMGSGSGLANDHSAQAEPIFKREIVDRFAQEREEFPQGIQNPTPFHEKENSRNRAPALQYIFNQR